MNNRGRLLGELTFKSVTLQVETNLDKILKYKINQTIRFAQNLWPCQVRIQHRSLGGRLCNFSKKLMHDSTIRNYALLASWAQSRFC